MLIKLILNQGASVKSYKFAITAQGCGAVDTIGKRNGMRDIKTPDRFPALS